VLLPLSSEDTTWPAELGVAHRLDLREPGGLDDLRRWIATSQRCGPAVIREQPFVEETTGLRFLWVPGGTFDMGMKGVEEPVHRVSLTPYWLTETPVTNAQYAKFLDEMRHTNQTIDEPDFWRDRRFAHPEQPVTAISWDDAMRFCTWLSHLLELQAPGITATLPSEAQWEYAARGTDGRPYPWGHETPDDTRAVFDRKDGPARVGSCPAGRGPFGHLDLGGNVWQWCRDGYNIGTYNARSRNEPLDPVAPWEDLGRVLRGSGWNLSGVWTAAARLGSRSGGRVDRSGLRVVAQPARS